MKLFCEACQRLGEPGPWSVIDGVLHVACGACGTNARLAPQAAVPAPAVAAAGGMPAPRPAQPPRAVPPPPVRSEPVGVASPTPPNLADDRNDIDRVLAEFIDTPAAPIPLHPAWSLAAASASLAEQETSAALAVARPEETLDDEPWLAIGWAQLQQHWNDPGAHQRLLAEAAARGDFSALGSRYREHLKRSPGDRVALAARDELLKKATAHMFTRMPREDGIGPEQAKSLRNVLLVVFLLGVIGFGGWVLAHMGGVF